MTEQGRPYGTLSARDLLETGLRRDLAALEIERQAALSERTRRYRTGAVIVIPMILLVFFGLAALQWSIGWGIAATWLGGTLVWGWGLEAQKTFERTARSRIIDRVCEEIGDITYDDAAARVSLAPFDALGILPHYTKHQLSGALAGRYRNCEFEVAKAELRRSGRRGSSRKVFDGLIMRISMPTPVRGRVMITRDQGTVLNRLGQFFSSATRVEIPHHTFEAKFEVYADHADQAHRFVTPVFVQNFLALRSNLGGTGLTGGFQDRWFHVALDGVPSFLAVARIDAPLTNIEKSIEQAIQEVVLIYRIIDQLHDAPEQATTRARTNATDAQAPS
ncbi:MAG: DUF3137 domain-containing protein [Hyphomicrobiaceae bacterium]